MIEIKITTENAAEMHEELSQLLFGVKAQKREVVNSEAPVPGPGEKLVRDMYEKEAKIVKVEEAPEEESKEEVAEPVKEPVKRKSRAKTKVEEPKEEPAKEEETKEEEPAKEEETKEEESTEVAAPVEEAKTEDEPEDEATEGEITIKELRLRIAELNKIPEKSQEMKKQFAKQQVKNVLDLNPDQIKAFFNDIKHL